MAPKIAFSTTLLKVAIHYIYAREMDLPVADLQPGECEEAVDELTEVLSDLGVARSREVAQQICHTSLTASIHVKEKKAQKLSVSIYDRGRKEVLAELGLESAKGAQLWPPTSQTIISRLGGKWSTAMEACGLAASSDGKIGRRNTRFTEEDRRAALREYLKDCESEGANPSYAGYTKWAKEQGGVPSGATLRQTYGTWQRALDQVL